MWKFLAGTKIYISEQKIKYIFLPVIRNHGYFPLKKVTIVKAERVGRKGGRERGGRERKMVMWIPKFVRVVVEVKTVYRNTGG